MSMNIDWQQFIIGEGVEDKNIFTYLQGLQEILNNLRPKTMTEQRRVALAKQHLREIKRASRKMLNEMNVLQEKINILEESRTETVND